MSKNSHSLGSTWCGIMVCSFKIDADIWNTFPTCILGAALSKASSENWKFSSKDAEGFFWRALHGFVCNTNGAALVTYLPDLRLGLPQLHLSLPDLSLLVPWQKRCTIPLLRSGNEQKKPSALSLQHFPSALSLQHLPFSTYSGTRVVPESNSEWMLVSVASFQSPCRFPSWAGTWEWGY